MRETTPWLATIPFRMNLLFSGTVCKNPVRKNFAPDFSVRLEKRLLLLSSSEFSSQVVGASSPAPQDEGVETVPALLARIRIAQAAVLQPLGSCVLEMFSTQGGRRNRSGGQIPVEGRQTKTVVRVADYLVESTRSMITPSSTVDEGVVIMDLVDDHESPPARIGAGTISEQLREGGSEQLSSVENFLLAHYNITVERDVVIRARLVGGTPVKSAGGIEQSSSSARHGGAAGPVLAHGPNSTSTVVVNHNNGTGSNNGFVVSRYLTSHLERLQNIKKTTLVFRKMQTSMFAKVTCGESPGETKTEYLVQPPRREQRNIHGRCTWRSSVLTIMLQEFGVENMFMLQEFGVENYISCCVLVVLVERRRTRLLSTIRAACVLLLTFRLSP